MNTSRVVALLPLFVMLAHSFPWDIVVGKGKRLEFFNNGTVTHTEHIPSAKFITTVTYDPVHFRVLFVSNSYFDVEVCIYSFDLTTRKVQTLVKRQASLLFYISLAYDPVRQLLFWTEDKEIYSLSLEAASFNEAANGKLIVTMDFFSVAIAVDSCGGYIYWATTAHIERAAFDGSKREFLIDGVLWQRGLAIDPEMEKMYWIDETEHNQFSIESADLNGKNRRQFYFLGTEHRATALTVSKDFIYWWSYNQCVILQLPKYQKHSLAPVVHSQYSKQYCWYADVTAANYTIEDQTLENKFCEAQKSVTHHGSICHNYCFKGNCTVSAEGQPRCRCDTGYSGDRCEVNPCRGYCLNNGDCSFNEEEQPVCRCSADYGGDRCEFPTVLIKCIQTVSMLR